MRAKWKWTLSGVFVVLTVMGGASVAQAEAYKCGANSYSQQPCSRNVVNTEEHRVPSVPKSSSAMTRRLPGESDEAYALRSRRASLSQSDQDECKRLDTKIPFEQERLKKADAEETAEAQESLATARKRFSQLRC